MPKQESFAYVQRKGTTNRFKVGKGDDPADRSKGSIRNIEPSYREFARIKVGEGCVFDCETYLKNRLESKRVPGTKEVFDLSSEDEMTRLLAECREYFEEYLPLKREVETLGKQSEGPMIPARPEHREMFTKLAAATERRDELDWQIELLQHKLKCVMGKAPGIEGLVSWKTNARITFLDVDALEPEDKEIYDRLFEKYKALRPPSRPFKFVYLGDLSISEELDVD